MSSSREPLASPAVEPPRERDASGAAPPSPAGRPAGARGPAAVIVCHGMGEQVEFETLNLVAEALWKKQASAPMDADAVRVRYVAFGDDWLPRVEMTLRTAGGALREVHLYEVYWAPLTEGRVTLADVFLFLFGAGWRGLAFSARGTFDRWMFGRRQAFAIPARGLYSLALALAAACVLALAYPAVAALAVAHALAVAAPGWAAGIALHLLGGAAAWCALVLAMLGAGALLGAAAGRVAEAIGVGRGTNERPGVAARAAAAGAAAAVVGGAAVAGAAGATSAASLLHAARAPAETIDAALVIVGVMLLLVIRRFLVQLVGDVAAYVSAHRVSRFREIRRDIQAAGRRVARNVYGSRVPGTGALEYADVLLVGHSLGSVIAYDVLDHVVNRDLLLASGTGGGARLYAAERTRLLLTMGSPLDKTAFLFRTQKDDLPVREALAAAVQPLIVDYAHRPARWVNIQAPFDWIGGTLEYYDAHPVPAAWGSRVVENVRERGAPWNPVAAHTGYWTRAEFAARLYGAL